MVVDCLLKHGADMDYRILDDSSLWLAMEHKRIAVVSLLVESMDLSKLHSNEQYMLPSCCFLGLCIPCTGAN